MTKHMKNIMKTLIELFLMVIWWTCLWLLYKENMSQLILTIIHVVVTILSSFFHRHIPFKQTWVFMEKLFHLTKFMWRNLFISSQYQFSLWCLYKKPNPLTQCFFKDNNQWKRKRYMLRFEGCSSTVLKVYITERL